MVHKTVKFWHNYITGQLGRKMNVTHWPVKSVILLPKDNKWPHLSELQFILLLVNCFLPQQDIFPSYFLSKWCKHTVYIDVRHSSPEKVGNTEVITLLSGLDFICVDCHVLLFTRPPPSIQRFWNSGLHKVALPYSLLKHHCALYENTVWGGVSRV